MADTWARFFGQSPSSARLTLRTAPVPSNQLNGLLAEPPPPAGPSTFLVTVAEPKPHPRCPPRRWPARGLEPPDSPGPFRRKATSTTRGTSGGASRPISRLPGAQSTSITAPGGDVHRRRAADLAMELSGAPTNGKVRDRQMTVNRLR